MILDFIRSFEIEGCLFASAFVLTAVAFAKRREIGLLALLLAVGSALAAQIIAAYTMTRVHIMPPPSGLIETARFFQHMLFPPLLAIAAFLLAIKKRPNQSPQRNAGSRPSSDDSPVSEMQSSLGPRG